MKKSDYTEKEIIKKENSMLNFFKTNIIFLITMLFVLSCITLIICFYAGFYGKLKTASSESMVKTNTFERSEPQKKSEINNAVQKNTDSKKIGEMYAWYYFDRIVSPDYSGILYDADNDGEEEYVYEKKTQYFYKKYNGKKLVSYEYLPPNSILSSFKNEELTEECRQKAAEYGYCENDDFEIVPENTLLGMTVLKTEPILLLSKAQNDSAVLNELPGGLFINCLTFYDSMGNFTSDGAYNGTYAWSEVVTFYKGNKIRGFIKSDDLILDDKSN